MRNAAVLTRANAGLSAPEVIVEVHLSSGLPAFNVVGLPESSVREARERVRSAILMSHFDWPESRITVNLAPADLPKRGGQFDLPIAVGLLVASGQLPASAISNREFYGELALDGRLRGARGLLSAARSATLAERSCVVPAVSAGAIAAVPNSRVIAADDLLTLCALIKQHTPTLSSPAVTAASCGCAPDLCDVRGQETARRALEIAAAGEHHLLMTGPPGAGKTMLAERLPGILPECTADEILARWLISDLVGNPLAVQRPFRSPHHSASAVSLVGGGPTASPGEITLAHGGVLFLDELPEFPRSVLDTLRQPLEAGTITVSRALGRYVYPAQFQLIAAMNPCPCGYLGSDTPSCRCSPEQIHRYRSRVSGPLLDRIDLHIALSRQPAGQILQTEDAAESSALVRHRVEAARRRQLDRQACTNGRLSGEQALEQCALSSAARDWFQKHCDRMLLSVRGIHRVLRVARTLADLNGERRVDRHGLLEALAFRPPHAGDANP